MAQIISSGIGSGLDVSGLVSQLVQAERAPVENRLNTKEIKAQSRLSAYGTLKSSLSSFQSALTALQNSELYQGRTSTVSNKDLFTVSAGDTASVGNYTIQAENLASRHKLASTAFADDDTSVGTGTLTFTISGESFDLEISSGSDSLSAIRDAVNDASDNVGVKASIIRDENGSHLIFTADETGADNAITISATTTGTDTGDLTQLNFDPNAIPANNPMTEQQEALDATLIIDGFTAKSATNTFDNVIDDVSINLKDSEAGQKESLDIALDKSAVKKAINQFVQAYNTLRDNINTLKAYDPDTGAAGLLQGDSATNRLSSQLRQAISDTVSGADADLDTLAEIGITTNFENGTLKVDKDMLDSLVDERFDDFVSLFAGDNGLASRLDGLADQYTKFEGTLDTLSNGLQGEIDRITDQRESLARRLASVEARYLQQFNALDTLLGELNQTSSFLTSQLDNLPGFTKKD
ncbi:flagellar hook-associated protein 2 [Litorivivens lipolytica]|uniref:Flagellar hook-associated protein 2 n=1 Tax=Litorivivens lipolytica TaxID=1524264 RepID=A0A7W4W2R5_9GAMM|nr:flagellar filament capping protein FliD [Litorivivens lipolytica]MBB3046373.1 flagellar hook-associated protein 2 [Litorivivens lipolytica]